MIPSKVLADPKLREELMKSVVSLDRERKLSDAGAFIVFLSSLPEVKSRRFGPQVIAWAECFVDRRRRVPRSICGGPHRFMAEIWPRSTRQPHLFLRNITGRVYVAGAIEDASFPEEQKNRLEQALAKAGVDHVVETYPGARHGFAVPDVPVFDSDAAERHWAVLFNSSRDACS